MQVRAAIRDLFICVDNKRVADCSYKRRFLLARISRLSRLASPTRAPNSQSQSLSPGPNCFLTSITPAITPQAIGASMNVTAAAPAMHRAVHRQAPAAVSTKVRLFTLS